MRERLCDIRRDCARVMGIVCDEEEEEEEEDIDCEEEEDDDDDETVGVLRNLIETGMCVVRSALALSTRFFIIVCCIDVINIAFNSSSEYFANVR